MRWNAPTPGKQAPYPFQPRFVKYFAWVPTSMDDGTQVWLEHYEVVERWVPQEFRKDPLEPPGWVPCERAVIKPPRPGDT